MKKNLLIAAVILAVLFGGLFGFNYYRKAHAGMAFANYRPPPVQVVATRAGVGNMPRTWRARGPLEGVRRGTVSPEVGGRIPALHFQPGKKARAAQPLV